MAFKLMDDAEVFEAALSFLDLPSVLDGRQDRGHDEVDAAHSASKGAVSNVNSRTGATKKRRTYNPNRAREAQRSELLALREQVPSMEKRLNVLQDAALARRRDAISAGTDKLEGSWRKLAKHQLQTRMNAEAEKARLGDLVREHAAITTQRVQQLVHHSQQLQVRSSTLLGNFGRVSRGQKSSLHLRPFNRAYAVPLVRSDAADFQTLVNNIDKVYHEVLHVFNAGLDTEGTRGLENAQYRMFADKTLPFDVHATGAAAWHYFAHSMGRKTARFHDQTSPYQVRRLLGLVADDTVVEGFGVERRTEKLSSDWKVKQVFRRFVAADRVVIAWLGYIDPSSFKGEAVSGVRFEEKGAFVIESGSKHQDPCHQATAVVRTWQVVTPALPVSEWNEHSTYTHELTEYMANSIRPGRAVQTVERTLQVQSMLPAHVTSQQAVASGRLSDAKHPLTTWINSDSRANASWTVLIVAAEKGQTVNVQRLLDVDAEMDVRTSQGYTALLLAAWRGHLGVVRALVSHGAAVDLADAKGHTPLMMAAKTGQHDIVQYLVKQNANVDARTKNGWTALYVAVFNDQLSAVRVLLDSGATVDSADDEGFAPLMVAARKGNADMVQSLLDHQASVDATTAGGCTVNEDS
ncbi:hypothetical protein BBJ28_00020947 [Nothophytophthora sp. Chile5]|nr:hypothetical protein BBJ28_00020947 [Nothophytophthora sp. Chile5]